MKSKIGKILTSSLLAVSMIASALPLSVSAATKSGNTNEATIDKNITDHSISCSNSNGWQVRTKNNKGEIEAVIPSVSALKKYVYKDSNNKDQVKNVVDDFITVKTSSALKTALKTKVSSGKLYRYINIAEDFELDSNINIPAYTILYINKHTIDCNNKRIVINGNNVLVTGDGTSDTTIKNSKILNGTVQINGKNNTAIRCVKLTNEDDHNINQRILYTGTCKNSVINNCELNNNSTSGSSTRITVGTSDCASTVTNLKIFDCSSNGSSPYLIRTNANSKLNGFQMSSNDTISKKVKIYNSNNIYISDTHSLPYEFEDTNNIYFPAAPKNASPYSTSDLTFTGCNNFRVDANKINGNLSIKGNSTDDKTNNFRIYNSNVTGTTTIAHCYNFTIYSTIFAKKVDVNDCYYFNTDRNGDDSGNNKSYTNVFKQGLYLTNCRNFILNHCNTLDSGSTLKITASNSYSYFTIENTKVKTLSISNMKQFTLESTCTRNGGKGGKPHKFTNCKYYKNYSH